MVEPVADSYANHWRLDGDGAVFVRPAGQSRWSSVPPTEPAEPTGWQFLLADHVGFIWIGGPGGLCRLNPHDTRAGWQHCQSLPDATVTALTVSANGLALVGFSTGAIVEVDIDAAGATTVQVLPAATGAVSGLWCDGDGSLVVTTAVGQAVRPASATAWQHCWRPLASLPGGNHDLFAIDVGGKLFMAGGLTSGYGYPPRTHVFDELFAYDPAADVWHVLAHMPFPRCYSGIAELDGKIWIVGGAANLSAPDDPDGAREPLADVQLFDCASGTWSQGPPLVHPRLEPVVLVAAGRIWVIGGTDGEPLTQVESIGAGESAWHPEPSLPWPQNQADGCVLDDTLYCMSRSGFLCFDTTLGRWQTDLPQLETSPQAPQVAAFRRQVWVMGGSRRSDSYIYDPWIKAWSDGPGLPTDNSWGAALDLHGTLVVAGGAYWSQRHERYFFDNRVIALRDDAPPGA